MVCIVIGARKLGVNPDNIATPIAASLGDLITLSILAFISSFFYKYKGRGSQGGGTASKAEREGLHVATTSKLGARGRNLRLWGGVGDPPFIETKPGATEQTKVLSSKFPGSPNRVSGHTGCQLPP